jgi:uncharacterized membrane protein
MKTRRLRKRPLCFLYHCENTFMKKFGVWFFGFVLIGMGILHFVQPDTFVAIIPQNWPSPEALNILAGIAEVLLGVGFLINQTRVISGYIICLMLVAFWILHGIHIFHPPSDKLPFWGYVARFLFQPVLIFLVWKLKDYRPKMV